MTADPVQVPEQRLPLSRERVLRTAVAIADEHGIDAVTMRRVGDELGAEAMSLYHHVANKADLLDGAVDLVVAEINEAVDGLDPRRRLEGRRARPDPHRPPGAAPAPLGPARAGDALGGEPERGALPRPARRPPARGRASPTTSSTTRCTPWAAGRWASPRSCSTRAPASRRHPCRPTWPPTSRSSPRCWRRSRTTTLTRPSAGATTGRSSSSGWTCCSTVWSGGARGLDQPYVVRQSSLTT